MAMVIKYGSVKRENVAASGDVTVPTSRWIGVRSTDVTDPERRFNALTDEGKRILGGVRRRAVEHGEDQVVAEVDLMQRSARTYQLQHLTEPELLQIIRDHVVPRVADASKGQQTAKVSPETLMKLHKIH